MLICNITSFIIQQHHIACESLKTRCPWDLGGIMFTIQQQQQQQQQQNISKQISGFKEITRP